MKSESGIVVLLLFSFILIPNICASSAVIETGWKRSFDPASHTTILRHSHPVFMSDIPYTLTRDRNNSDLVPSFLIHKSLSLFYPYKLSLSSKKVNPPPLLSVVDFKFTSSPVDADQPPDSSSQSGHSHRFTNNQASAPSSRSAATGFGGSHSGLGSAGGGDQRKRDDDPNKRRHSNTFTDSEGEDGDDELDEDQDNEDQDNEDEETVRLKPSHPLHPDYEENLSEESLESTSDESELVHFIFLINEDYPVLIENIITLFSRYLLSVFSDLTPNDTSIFTCNIVHYNMHLPREITESSLQDLLAKLLSLPASEGVRIELDDGFNSLITFLDQLSSFTERSLVEDLFSIFTDFLFEQLGSEVNDLQDVTTATNNTGQVQIILRVLAIRLNKHFSTVGDVFSMAQSLEVAMNIPVHFEHSTPTADLSNVNNAAILDLIYAVLLHHLSQNPRTPPCLYFHHLFEYLSSSTPHSIQNITNDILEILEPLLSPAFQKEAEAQAEFETQVEVETQIEATPQRRRALTKWVHNNKLTKLLVRPWKRLRRFVQNSALDSVTPTYETSASLNQIMTTFSTIDQPDVTVFWLMGHFALGINLAEVANTDLNDFNAIFAAQNEMFSYARTLSTKVHSAARITAILIWRYIEKNKDKQLKALIDAISAAIRSVNSTLPSQ